MERIKITDEFIEKTMPAMAILDFDQARKVVDAVADAQLTADRAELEKVKEILRQCHDFLDRHNAEYATAKELCLVCHSNRWNGIGITHEEWCPILKARKYITQEE